MTKVTIHITTTDDPEGYDYTYESSDIPTFVNHTQGSISFPWDRLFYQVEYYRPVSSGTKRYRMV